MAYSEALADVLYAADAFEASGEVASMPRVAAAIGEARAHYVWVGRTWPMKLGRLSRYTLEVPNEEDAARYFGPTVEVSRAAAEEVRDRATDTGDLESYIDQLVARVLSRAGDLARDARRELQALTSES
jgi:DNA-binding MurR/RpiR family transcriptional regulator